MREGQRIRLAGQGEAGAGGGKSGDLFLRVRLARHPDFTVEGSDLIHEVKIAPWQAVLGAEIKVPTLEGSVRMKIPQAHKAASVFVCAGAGCRHLQELARSFVMTQLRFRKKGRRPSARLWGSRPAKLHGISHGACRRAKAPRPSGATTALPSTAIEWTTLTIFRI